jgi:uncharacterized membrane protein
MSWLAAPILLLVLLASILAIAEAAMSLMSQMRAIAPRADIFFMDEAT